MTFAAQPVSSRQQEAQELSKRETQKKFKEQADRIKNLNSEKSNLEQELAVQSEQAKTLQGRVKELEEIHNAMALQLNEAQNTNDALHQKVGQQAHLLLYTLKQQNETTKERTEAFNKLIADVSSIIIGGNKPAEAFYEQLNQSLEAEKEKQNQTLELLKINSPAFLEEVKLRKELCDNHNGILSNNQEIHRSINYLRDLSNTPEEIRKLAADLNEIQANVGKLAATDFLTADKETVLELQQKFTEEMIKLGAASRTFDNISRSDNFKDLLARINKIADTALTPIADSDLEEYEFYTTAGKEAAIGQLTGLAKTDQERYVQLRKLVSEQWNSIVQQIAQLHCETNLLYFTLNLHLPLMEHHAKLDKLSLDLRLVRRATPVEPNLENINELKTQLNLAKQRFLEALTNQNELSKKYLAQLKPRDTEESIKTLHDLIKDEIAQTTKQSELTSSVKNRATQEADVDQQLTVLHKDLQRKYEDFQTKILDLWRLIDEKGNDAATEMMRLEDATENKGIFTTQTYYSAKEITAGLGLARVPPYRGYWNNPAEGLAKLGAAPVATPDALPQAV